MPVTTPESHTDEFIDKYTPEVAAQGRAVLKKMRARLPGAVELVYDNYNFLVFGFGPSDRASEAVFSVVFAPRWISLCFLKGAKLKDPHKRLKGEGNVVRSIRLAGPADLDDPIVESLIAQALEKEGVTLNEKKNRRLVIKSVSAKQRPRRPAQAQAVPERNPRLRRGSRLNVAP